MIHCLLLVAASPIWSLLFNCYPPLLVFGLCCLVISILLTGYFSLLLAICHVVAYFQNVRVIHCIALLLCWPLLLTLLVFLRCREAVVTSRCMWRGFIGHPIKKISHQGNQIILPRGLPPPRPPGLPRGAPPPQTPRTWRLRRQQGAQKGGGGGRRPPPPMFAPRRLFRGV